MAERSELALNEEEGMRRVPHTGGEPWVTRLKPPHPTHVSVAAGALLTVTSSRSHSYMIAYTLDDAGLLNTALAEPVADSELRDRVARAIFDDAKDNGANPFSLTWDELQSEKHRDQWLSRADAALGVVAPVLAARDQKITYLTGEVTRESQNSEFSDDALHLVLGCCDPTQHHPDLSEECSGRVEEVYEAMRRGAPIPYRWQEVTDALVARIHELFDARQEIAKAHELLLALGADTDWPHPPPSLPDRIHLLRLDLQATGMNFAEIQRQLAEMLAADEETAIPDLLALARDQLDVLAGAIEPHGECRPECDCGDHRGPGSCGCHVTGEEAREWIRRLESERETLLCITQPDNEDIELTAMLKDRSTEPRVWRKGDPEPPDSIQVLVDCKDDHLPYLCRIPGTEWWQWFDRPADRDRAPGGVPWNEATSVMGSSKKDYLVPLPGFSELDSPTGGTQ